jgi:uncharacterized membrane protein
MNSIHDVVVPNSSAQPQEGLRTLTHVMYGLHLLSWFSAGMFSVVAMVINHVKKDDLPNDFYRSHFRWQSRSFWFTLLWLLVTSPLFVLVWLPGMAAWSVVGLWYLYRFVRGWWAFNDNRAMPMPA